MSAETLLTFWSEERWGREYGYRPPSWEDNPYDLGYHIAQDIVGGSWLGSVPVLRAGTIVATGRSSKIGGFVSIVADEDGLVDTYCHLSTASMPRAGARVSAGDDLPRLARSQRIADGHEYMGSASTGPHCHFAVTTTRDGAYNPRRGNDRDPRPIILRALSGRGAGNGARPFEPEEDDMPTAEEIAAAVWSFGVGENGQPGVNNTPAWRRLGIAQTAAEEAGRLGAQFALYTYGTGIVAMNKITNRWMILAPGYAELLQHLGLAAPGSRKIDEGQFKYVTQYVPAATGLPDLSQAEGFDDADLEAIKKAISENRVALSQEQYDRLVADVTAGAAAGGEGGARAALEKLTLVVKAP